MGGVEAEAEGTVRVTAPPGVADAFLVPLVAELRARHPRITLELDARVSVVDLTRGEADLALRTIRPRSGALVMTRLAEVRSVPMASAAYARELGALRAIDDARWIHWGRDLAQLPEQRWLDAHAHGAPALRTSHMSSQIAAAHAGVGAVLLPEPYAEVHELVAVRPGRALQGAWATLPIGELWLVGHQALRFVPRVAAVWELIVARLTLPVGASR
jgi:DNA-binding transcriptional LysR family regulator